MPQRTPGQFRKLDTLAVFMAWFLPTPHLRCGQAGHQGGYCQGLCGRRGRGTFMTFPDASIVNDEDRV